ncbi:MAG TPA: phosphatase PAP2 family protein [Thermodesulfobacteriota bacterium]|nr:phosphatase PAP2 family protein [Thermodesulfobacteriota bacterium]
MGLQEIDQALFFWINAGQRNFFFDRIMPYITEFDHWKYWILLIWVVLFIAGGKKLKITLLMTAILVGILDYSNSFFFKHLFTRPRPCNALSQVHTFWPCPRSFSFPSNHATSTFGAAFFLSHTYRNWGCLLFPMALVVGYSRIYVGEHYPFDVLGGFFMGFLGSVVFIWIQNKAFSKWLPLE